MAKELPDDISRPSEVQPSKMVSGDEGPQKTPQKPFESYMEEGGKAPEAGGKISPFDLAGEGTGAGKGAASMESVLSQMNATSGSLGDIQNKLNTKNLKLKQSQKYLLRNKLTEANSQIRSAAEKAGVNIDTPPPAMTRQNPIARFLALITDGQNQLNQAQENLQNLSKDGKSLDTGKLMLIQVKLAKAQREIEYSSVLLSKAVQDIQTLFNVQI
ncbi:MAG: hypothetical protein Tsb0015_02620 [Simkaniaceae bacterium]